MLKLLAASALALLPTLAQSATITSGFVYNVSGGTPANHLRFITDQSGLLTPYTSGVTDFDTYMSSMTGYGITSAFHTSSETEGGAWINVLGADAPYPTDIDVSFASSAQILTKMVLWNGTKNNTWAIKSFEVYASNDRDFSTSTKVGSFTNVIGSNGSEPGTIFDLTDTTADYLRIRVLSNYGGRYFGLGEIAFATEPEPAPSAVPVPASLPLLAAGLGGLTLLRRKSRKA